MLIPDKTGAFVTLNLTLPAKIDLDSLAAVFAGQPAATDSVTRQIIVLWNPRGDPKLPTEVAVIWSRIEDEEFWASIVSKKYPLLHKKICNRLVLASTEQQLLRMQASCTGAEPSILSAPPVVAKGLRTPTSLGLSVNLGSILSQLLVDGWLSEPKALKEADAKANRPSAPPEVQSAATQVEMLPFLHWGALVDEKGQWIAGGFRS